MKSVTKRLATGLAVGAFALSTTVPAVAFDPQEDANLMAYWKMDLGPVAKDDDRTAFGFAANKNLNSSNSAYSYGFGRDVDTARPAFVDIQFSGSTAILDSVSLNGTDVLTKTTVLNADGSEGVVFGLEWWQVGVAAFSIATAGYLLYEGLSDDDDDESSGDAGGGGTSGTPLDAALDPLAEAGGF